MPYITGQSKLQIFHPGTESNGIDAIDIISTLSHSAMFTRSSLVSSGTVATQRHMIVDGISGGKAFGNWSTWDIVAHPHFFLSQSTMVIYNMKVRSGPFYYIDMD